jgi:hypothetical protein
LLVRFRDDSIDESPALRDTLALRAGVRTKPPPGGIPVKGSRASPAGMGVPAGGDRAKPAEGKMPAGAAANGQTAANGPSAAKKGTPGGEMTISYVEIAGTHLTPLTPSPEAPLPELAALLQGLGFGAAGGGAGLRKGMRAGLPLPEPLRAAQTYLGSSLGEAATELDDAGEQMILFLDEAVEA